MFTDDVSEEELAVIKLGKPTGLPFGSLKQTIPSM